MMGILLDTHIFLWWSLQPEKLPPVVLKALQDPGNRIFFSTVSSWEAQIKIGLGKLILEESLRKIVEREIAQNNWKSCRSRSTIRGNWSSCRHCTRILSTTCSSPRHWLKTW
jgi:PIN domain nuclease of toxin-antitoxin system